MISITVQRQPGDKPGPQITDHLLTTEAVALERGRNEIDALCSNRALVSCTGPYRRFILPGTLIEYQARRSTFRGIVRRCALNVSRDGDRFSAEFALEIEREL